MFVATLFALCALAEHDTFELRRLDDPTQTSVMDLDEHDAPIDLLDVQVEVDVGIEMDVGDDAPRRRAVMDVSTDIDDGSDAADVSVRRRSKWLAGKTKVNCCSTVSVSGGGSNVSSRMGTYTHSHYWTTYGNVAYPAYKNGNQYLFYVAQYGRWLVGPQLGVARASVLSLSSGTCPNNVNSWAEIHWSGRYWIRSSTKMTCSTAGAPASTPVGCVYETCPGGIQVSGSNDPKDNGKYRVPPNYNCWTLKYGLHTSSFYVHTANHYVVFMKSGSNSAAKGISWSSGHGWRINDQWNYTGNRGGWHPTSAYNTNSGQRVNQFPTSGWKNKWGYSFSVTCLRA